MSKINDKKIAERCSVCGSPVWHHSSDEGTHYYSPRSTFAVGIDERWREKYYDKCDELNKAEVEIERLRALK